jgi:hypothetical protein
MLVKMTVKINPNQLKLQAGAAVGAAVGAGLKINLNGCNRPPAPRFKINGLATSLKKRLLIKKL